MLISESTLQLLLPGFIPIPVLVWTWWSNRNNLREAARLAAAAVEQQYENALKLQEGIDKIDIIKKSVDGAASEQRVAIAQLHETNTALKTEVSRLNAGTTTAPVTETPVVQSPNQVTQGTAGGGQVDVSGIGRRIGDDSLPDVKLPLDA